MNKAINFELAESLARLGCNQKTIANALGFSESGFENCKAHNAKLRSCLERGWNSLIVDVQEALTNRAMGLAKWESDPVKKAKGLGLKGADTKCLIYLAEKLEPSTSRIELSESKESPLFIKTFAEMVACGNEEEKQVKSDTGQKMPKKAPKVPVSDPRKIPKRQMQQHSTKNEV